jgi:hypothetical protein
MNSNKNDFFFARHLYPVAPTILLLRTILEAICDY